MSDMPGMVISLDPDGINPMTTEFERGRLVGLRQARDEYARGFTDALMICFAFSVLGGVIAVALAAVIS